MTSSNWWALTSTQNVIPWNTQVDGSTLIISNGVLRASPGNLHLVTTGSTYTVAPTDAYVLVQKASGSATTINLPALPTTGAPLLIKDAKGDAATNNITITATNGLIDGSTSVLINRDYGAATLVFSGTDWSIV